MEASNDQRLVRIPVRDLELWEETAAELYPCCRGDLLAHLARAVLNRGGRGSKCLEP